MKDASGRKTLMRKIKRWLEYRRIIRDTDQAIQELDGNKLEVCLLRADAIDRGEVFPPWFVGSGDDQTDS